VKKKLVTGSRSPTAAPSATSPACSATASTSICRLRHGGSAHSFGFAIYSAAHDSYQDAILRTGLPACTPQEALDDRLHDPPHRVAQPRTRVMTPIPAPTNLRGQPRVRWPAQFRTSRPGRPAALLLSRASPADRPGLTATMPHHGGQDRINVTSWRLRWIASGD